MAGAIISITGDSGGAELPAAGNFTLAGTANQILVAGSAATQTFSLIGPYTPSTFTNHGVLLGAGTSSIAALAVAATGTIMVGVTGANPKFLTAGTTGQLLSAATGADPAYLTAGTTGQVLTGSTGSQPAFATLGTNSGLTSHGVLLGENNSAIVATTAGSNGQVLLGSSAADPAFGTLTTSTGIAFTTGAAALAIDVKTGGYAVVDQNTSSVGVAVQTMYVIDNGASLVTLTLPATAAQGTVFKVIGSSAGGWKIAQNASQKIVASGNTTTTGTGGSLSSTSANDCVELIASVGGANTVWTTASSSGTLTFV